jgi:hypothetical protein
VVTVGERPLPRCSAWEPVRLEDAADNQPVLADDVVVVLAFGTRPAFRNSTEEKVDGAGHNVLRGALRPARSVSLAGPEARVSRPDGEGIGGWGTPSGPNGINALPPILFRDLVARLLPMPTPGDRLHSFPLASACSRALVSALRGDRKLAVEPQ